MQLGLNVIFVTHRLQVVVEELFILLRGLSQVVDEHSQALVLVDEVPDARNVRSV